MSPFDLNVRDLVHRPGEMRERTLDVPAPEQYGAGAATVKEGTSLEIDLKLEGLHEGILVSAEIETEATGECVRCLDPETGEKLADNPDRSPREVLDPRWAALEGFTPDSEKK